MLEEAAAIVFLLKILENFFEVVVFTKYLFEELMSNVMPLL